MAEGSIAAVFCYRTLQAALAAGVDPAALPKLEVTGKSGLEERIPFGRYVELWESLMRASQKPGLPVRMAERITTSDYDAIGFACMTRATFGEALHQAVRFARVWTDASRWILSVDERAVSLAVEIEEPHRLGVRCGVESVVVEMIHAGRVLTGIPYAPLEVRFRHDRPRDTSDHERFLACPIVWGAPQNEIVVDADMLDKPLLKADPGLAAYFERHAAALLARFAEPEGMEYRLRSAIAAELPRGVPTLESIAPQLGMSTRTLRRRLQELETTFREVLDATRCELAKRYLADQALPVGAVGFMVGFSEPSTFHRAFKRWTGVTPAAFRRSPSPSMPPPP
jgi:AraC-like DNA-binding protein